MNTATSSTKTNSPKHQLISDKELYRVRHSLPGAVIRQEINKNIEQGSIPVFGYPLPSFENVTPPAEWSAISKAIFSNTKLRRNECVFSDILAKHRLIHLREEVLQKDFSKGIKLNERDRYHRIELQENGVYASVNADGSKFVVDGILDQQITINGMNSSA